MTGKTRRVRRVLGRSIPVLGVMALVLIVAGPVYIAAMNHFGARAADSVIREAEALGAIPQSPAHIPDDDNAAPLLRAAAWAISDPYDFEDNVPVIGSGEWPNFGKGFTDEEQAAIVREMVARNAAVFDLVDRAAAKPASRYDVDWRMFSDDILDILGATRRLTRWQQIRSLDAEARGDREEAMRAANAAFAINRSLNRHDLLLTHLVQISIDSLAITMLESMLSRLELQEHSLEHLATSLEQSRDALDLMDAMRGEVALVIPSLAYPRWGRIARQYEASKFAVHKLDLIADPEEQPAGDGLDLDELRDILSHTSFWDYLGRAAADTYFAWVPGHLQVTTAGQLRELLDVMAGFENARNQPQALIERMDSNSFDDTAEAARNALKPTLIMKTHLSVAIAAMRVEAFRVSRGDWPDSLRDIATSIPQDEYGQSLKLHAVPRGIVIYSVGLNGIDEKGVNARHDGTRGDEDDIAFELLSAEHRNTPPAVNPPD